jgi:hypothetical protein
MHRDNNFTFTFTISFSYTASHPNKCLPYYRVSCSRSQYLQQNISVVTTYQLCFYTHCHHCEQRRLKLTQFMTCCLTHCIHIHVSLNKNNFCDILSEYSSVTYQLLNNKALNSFQTSGYIKLRVTQRNSHKNRMSPCTLWKPRTSQLAYYL